MVLPRGSLSHLFHKYSLSTSPTAGSTLEARREPGQASCLPSGSLQSRVMALPAGHFSALEVQSPQLRRQRPRLRTGPGPRSRPARRRRRGEDIDLPIVWFLHFPLRFSRQRPAGEERGRPLALFSEEETEAQRGDWRDSTSPGAEVSSLQATSLQALSEHNS